MMGNFKFSFPVLALALATLPACTTTGPQQQAAAPPEPEMPAKVRPSEIIGRWGYAAYHRPDDRGRTEAAARSQCKVPYVIGAGPSGGLMMYLADQKEKAELTVKGSRSGKDYVGPREDPPGGPQDREVVSFYGRVLILRWIDPEVAGRYGTAIYVRCAPRA